MEKHIELLKKLKALADRGEGMEQKPLRIKRSRVKGFNLQEYSKSLNGLECVVVSRPSKWGNPYQIMKDEESKTFCVWQVFKGSQVLIAWAIPEKMALELALEKYRQYIEKHINYGNLKIEELKGKNLACFCSLSSPCHADILLERCR